MSAEDARASNVSRETLARLELFYTLLKKWNSHINLVSPTTLDLAWKRHFRDSLQLVDLVDGPVGHWVDLGTGGGFPGLVIAIAAHESDLVEEVTLVESDMRKVTFLRTVLRETGVTARVAATRIETLPSLGADLVSARALAPMPKLLGYVARHLAPGGIALLPKGAEWKKDVDNARTEWRFECECHKSETDPNAVILRIGDLEHA